jgi:Conserved TM helix
MVVQSGVSDLSQSFTGLLAGIVSFLPMLLFAIIIFIVGWFIAVWLCWIIEEAVKALRVDHALRSAGVEEVVNRSGYRLNSGKFLGTLVKWFVILVFLLAALQVLNLGAVTFFLEQIVVAFLPNVIIAVLILLVAAVLAEVAQGVVTGAARAAGITGAGFAGTMARWAIWVFAILAALEQLQIASSILQTLLTGVVVALALAFGLAFGLGGQESAARFLDRTREEMKNRRV